MTLSVFKSARDKAIAQADPVTIDYLALTIEPVRECRRFARRLGNSPNELDSMLTCCSGSIKVIVIGGVQHAV